MKNTKVFRSFRGRKKSVTKKGSALRKTAKFRFIRFSSKRVALLFMVLFAGVGGYIIFRSSAASQTVVATVEAESLTPPTGAGVIADANASGSQALQFTKSGTATGSVPLSAQVTSLTVRAKGVQCRGAPKMVVTIDNTQVLASSVGATGWTDYGATVNLSAKTRSISIAFTNDNNKGCSRDLYVDKITFFGQSYVYTRLSNPNRTQVQDSQGKWLATFTDGARTVALTGSARTFAEPAFTTATVNSEVWVRILPQPFNGQVDETWLTQKLADTSPDILQLGMQYIDGAPTINQGSLRIAGDADYGPLQPDGTRQEGSDFNDYLGIPWTYGSTTDQPESTQYGSLDCSGFQRMVWGYRSGLPLAIDPDGVGLPRRAFQMYDSAPGIVIVPNNGTQVTDFSKLQPGDLTFDDAATDDGTQIDHVGIYLGIDSAGQHRFLSSRKKANGPTMGDFGGKSVLEGTGLYAVSFRAVRRL